jgi:4-aminobutyrate aminotransferase-like enzyme
MWIKVIQLSAPWWLLTLTVASFSGMALFQRAKAALNADLGDLGEISCFISEIIPVAAGVVVPPKSYFQLLYP